MHMNLSYHEVEKTEKRTERKDDKNQGGLDGKIQQQKEKEQVG